MLVETGSLEGEIAKMYLFHLCSFIRTILCLCSELLLLTRKDLVSVQSPIFKKEHHLIHRPLTYMEQGRDALR